MRSTWRVWVQSSAPHTQTPKSWSTTEHCVACAPNLFAKSSRNSWRKCYVLHRQAEGWACSLAVVYSFSTSRPLVSSPAPQKWKEKKIKLTVKLCWFFFFVCLFLVILSFGCPGTRYVDQAGLELCASLLASKVCTIRSGWLLGN